MLDRSFAGPYRARVPDPTVGPGCLTDIRREEGIVMPLMALMLVLLMGFVAFAVDWGRMHEERRLLQNAVDAAALAGVHELPGSPSDATSVATTYLASNGVTTADAVINPVVLTTFVDNDTIRVDATRVVPTIFGRVLGVDEEPVSAVATAIVGSLGNNDCIMPLAAQANAPAASLDPPGPYELPADQPFYYYADYEYVVKVDAQNNVIGNFGGMNPWPPGQSEYKGALEGNCSSDEGIEFGTPYPTTPGGKAFKQAMETRFAGEDWSATLETYATKVGDLWYPKDGKKWEDLSPRFGWLPAVEYDDYQACGGSCSPGINIDGLVLFFATFAGCDDGTPNESNCPGGFFILRGYLVPAAADGPVSPLANDYGTRVERLWQ